jgi:hypothetical protein
MKHHDLPAAILDAACDVRRALGTEWLETVPEDPRKRDGPKSNLPVNGKGP